MQNNSTPLQNPKTMSSLDGGLEAIFLWPIWEFHLRNKIETYFYTERPD